MPASIDRLADDVVASILECLCVLPRGTWPYRPVCRRWHRISRERRIDRCTERREWDDLESNFRQRYEARRGRRTLLAGRSSDEAVAAETSLARMDGELTTRLSRAANHRYPRGANRGEASLEDDVEEIRRLLDAGAAASGLPDHELGSPDNAGGFVDTVFEPLSDSEGEGSPSRRRLDLLMDLVCSPCTSWRRNRQYVGNGGSCLPLFALRFVVLGDPWGCVGYRCDGGAAIEDRWRGWGAFRLMMLAANAVGDLPELCYHCFGAYKPLVCMDRLSKFQECPVRMFFFKRLFRFLHCDMGVTMKCIRESIFRICLHEGRWVGVDNIHNWCGAKYYLSFVISSGCNGDGIFDSDEQWESILKLFWGSKCMQKRLNDFIRKNRAFRMAIMREGAPSLSKRKDRRAFELLLFLEPLALSESVDKII